SEQSVRKIHFNPARRVNKIWSKYLKGDKVIWMVCLFLGMVSLLAVYSSISSLAYKYTQGDTLHYLF
ncbi:MAG: hypothetical protein AAGC47_10275, partial [Bacteroidota bacterium]